MLNILVSYILFGSIFFNKAHTRTTSTPHKNFKTTDLDFKESVISKQEIKNVLPYVALILTLSYADEWGEMWWYKVCTGTFIKKNLLLSTASCILIKINIDDSSPEDTRVYIRNNKKPIQVLRVFIHPKYFTNKESESNGFDLSLLHVENSPINIFPKLPKAVRKFEDIKDTCLLAGYGSMGEASLKTFNVTSLADSQTISIECEINIICIHFEQVMPCRGDWGSPLICGGELYAIYTPKEFPSNHSCKEVYFYGFSPIYRVLDWVDLIEKYHDIGIKWVSNPLYVLLVCVVVITIMVVIYGGVVEIYKRKGAYNQQESASGTEVYDRPVRYLREKLPQSSEESLFEQYEEHFYT